MTKEQLKGLKKGDVLVWTELSARVGDVADNGKYTKVTFDGSKTFNILEPGTLLLAQVEERILTGAEVLRMLADGRRPEEFEWCNRVKGRWYSLVEGNSLYPFLSPHHQFRVKP